MKISNARDFNPYASGVTIEQLQDVRRSLSKVMNQRMVRLEQGESSVSGEAYTYGAYDLMKDYLNEKGRKRFSEVKDVKGMDKSDLQREIRVLQGFEDLPSSTVSGQRKIENKRIETFEKMGISEKTASSKDFYDFLNSQTYQELMKNYTSEELIEDYSKAADSGVPPKKIKEAFRDYMNKAKRKSIKGLRRAINATTVKRRTKSKRRK